METYNLRGEYIFVYSLITFSSLCWKILPAINQLQLLTQRAKGWEITDFILNCHLKSMKYLLFPNQCWLGQQSPQGKRSCG